MGLVVAVRHLELGELFAVKLLLPEAAAQPQAVERFLREARAAARLKSEHVAKVTDVGRLTDGSPFMVMEHLSGTDLQQHVRQNGPLPVADAVMLTLQACEAISEAHSLGIIHRDLKPSNMFLTRRPGGSLSVKVLDFGISKQTTQETVDLTKTGDVFGTPLYMPPEQMARSKSVDARSDVWSMGVVLYELLTGTTPFHALTLTEVVARVLQEDAAPPSALRHGLPPGLDAIVARCLQKHKDFRFQTIDELSAALRGLTIADGTSRAEPMSNVPVSRPAALPIPEQSATLVLAAGPVPTGRTSRPEQSVASSAANTGAAWGATDQQQRKPPRSIVLWIAVAGIGAILVVFLAVWQNARSVSESGTPALLASMDAVNTVFPSDGGEVDAGSATVSSAPSAIASTTGPALSSTVAGPSSAARPTAAPPPSSSVSAGRRQSAPAAPKHATFD